MIRIQRTSRLVYLVELGGGRLAGMTADMVRRAAKHGDTFRVIQTRRLTGWRLTTGG